MNANIKSYKEFYRRLLFMEEERKKFFQEMSKVVGLGQAEKVKILLEVLKKEGRIGILAKHRENQGESMLHVAVKFNQTSEIIGLLIKACPELMTTIRKDSDDYYGQTPLHIAIAKGNIEAVGTMLSEILNHSQTVKAALLHQMATGVKFANTVMMGELPLSVAALTFNLDMIQCLLLNGAEMERKNTKGDTIFHSLIRFAAIYPLHLDNVLATMELLHMHIKEQMVSPTDRNVLSMECDHSDKSYIWFIPNSQDLNPLQLAATLSQPRIFEFILNLPKVYSFLNNHDGLFDSKLYDITEIDTIATEKWAGYQRQRRSRMQRHVSPVVADGVSQQKFSNLTPSTPLLDRLQREKAKSILEMMFDIRGSYAYEFIQQPTMRQIIKTKWLYYRVFYYCWMVFHLLFMTTLTVFAVLNADNYAEQHRTGNNSQSDIQNDTQTGFIDVFRYFYLVVGVVFFFHEVIHVLFRVKRFSLLQMLNVLHNGSYRIVLVIFSISLILDFILSLSLNDYENFTLIIALVTGWWFMVFFLRAHRKFSFFTVMIQKILFGDMLRFAVIIALFLVSFTASMYMTFQGSSTTDQNFVSYGSTMLLLFKLMLGLGEIEVLQEARRPWLAIALFVILVLLTYVLMFNALIAMMSQTCMLVSENRLVQWRVQQLSVIVFFESIFPSCMAKLVGSEKHVKRFDPEIKQVIDEKRYYLDMSSIQTEYANPEDIHSINVMKYKLQTMPMDRSTFFYPSLNLTRTYFPGSPRNIDNLANRQSNFPDNYGFRELVYNNNDQQIPIPSIKVNALQDSPKPSASPMAIKRKQSKRDKSPKIPFDHPAENHENGKQYKRKPRKKRIEPEGDINTSYDDTSPDRNFHLNHTHLSVPDFNVNNPIIERRRHNSENALTDTHIGRAQPKHIPVKPAHIPVEQISRLADNDKNGSLDIGVIADSYM